MHTLMPLPAEIELGDGVLEINDEFHISLSGQVEPRLERAAAHLTERLSLLTGIPCLDIWRQSMKMPTF